MSLAGPEDLVRYWEANGVLRTTVACEELCGQNDFSAVMGTLGFPVQDWWLFRFAAPSRLSHGILAFGKVGREWTLGWRERDGACVVSEGEGRERHANSSFLAFNRCLALFDQGYRRVQTECPGDSGADWNKGDVIVASMETEMRHIDPSAFESEDNLWPVLLLDING